MTATAYYNEIDPFAAAWLRNLIDAGCIAPGVVDTRSIEEVTANDLKDSHSAISSPGSASGLTPCGAPDGLTVAPSGQVPAPASHSASQENAGNSTTPATCGHMVLPCIAVPPSRYLGEQVASKDGLAWFDVVQLNLEEAEYAVAVVNLCAAGIGAPHIRQRLFWVADATYKQHQKRLSGCAESHRPRSGRSPAESTGYCLPHGLAHTNNDSRERRLSGWQDSQREVINGSSGCGGTDSRLAYADNEQRPLTLPAKGYEDISRQWNKNSEAIAGFSSDSGTSPVNGFWRDADWLFCRDGKWRPVKPGLKPLVNGLAGRVGQVRAYGNAIVAPVAETFIRAYMEAVTS